MNKSVIAIKPQGGFAPASAYQLRLTTAIKDLNNNGLANEKVFSFRTSLLQYSAKKTIDDFSVEGGYWMTPGYSGSTVGIIDSGTAFGFSTSYYMPASAPSKSAYLQYQWDPAASSKLIREYLSSGPPRDVTFDTSYTVQVFIYGDGSGNKFRFAIDEGNGTTWPNHEVSVWFSIDWIGWKLIEWQLNDPSMVGTWIGNGALDMPLYRVDSFQMTDATGSARYGRIYLDEFRIVKKTPLPNAVNDENLLPAGYALEQNYPNPFNPVTSIKYRTSSPALLLRKEKGAESPSPSEGEGFRVRLVVFDVLGREIAILVNEEQSPGAYTVEFNASSLPSGTYFYELRAGGFREVKKMILLR